MYSRRVTIGLIAGLAALGGWGATLPLAAEDDPAELSIGWVNVGGGSNQALMLVDKLVEKNLPNTKVKWVEFNGGSAGIAALNAAREQIPDVMLVDIGLPGIDGYEVARRVRRDPNLQYVMLVALTGYGREEDRQQAIAAGFDFHLVKPVSADALTDLVAQLAPDDAPHPTIH